MTTERERAAGPGDRWLLALLILTWAISWPVIKVAVSDVPPIWFAFLRSVIGAVCLVPLLALRREGALPPRADWPLVAALGILQMAAYPALTGLALTILPPGRASVLAYSTPIWVVPLAAWRLGERIPRHALLGVALGLAGVLVIAAPSLHAQGGAQVAAYGMLLAAAGAWAVAIVFVRGHRFTASVLALAPWQMLVAAGLLLPLALVTEGPLPPVHARGLAALAYVGPVGTAFAFWAVVRTGRRFPASTMSVALLATPGLGILISAATLGEPVGATLLAGVVLIGAGIRLATLVGRPRGARVAEPLGQNNAP